VLVQLPAFLAVSAVVICTPGPDTALTPDWDGERLDPEPILDALLPRRVRTAA
jgi:hypothetical protein